MLSGVLKRLLNFPLAFGPGESGSTAGAEPLPPLRFSTALGANDFRLACLGRSASLRAASSASGNAGRPATRTAIVGLTSPGSRGRELALLEPSSDLAPSPNSCPCAGSGVSDDLRAFGVFNAPAARVELCSGGAPPSFAGSGVKRRPGILCG